MGGTDRFDPDILTPLLDRASSLSFVALVRRLERMLETSTTVPVGVDGPPRDEPIRFRHDPSLAFVTADVTSARALQEQAAWGDGPPRELVEITTAFLGLTGSASPLPLKVIEEIAQEDDEHGPRRDFLDIFHHRLLSLLYRGLARLSVDSEFRSDGSDNHSKRLLALAGVDAFGVERVHSLDDTEMLRLVPIAATRRGTRHAIEAAIYTIFGSILRDARVHVTPLQGGFVEFDADQRISLARSNTQLGVDATIGRSVRHSAGRITVTIGPVGEDVHRAFSIGGSLADKLRNVLDFVMDGIAEVDVDLILLEDARPAARLDGSKKLGLDAFLYGGRGQARVRL